MKASDDPLFSSEEMHSYFPDWADRPVSDGKLLESDHNSYLAGGYAEVFGYQRHRGDAPAFPPLRGEPEASRLWRVQIGGLHPGYPECARPQDREHAAPGADASPPYRGAAEQICALRLQAEGQEYRDPAHSYGVVRVGAAAHHGQPFSALSSVTRRWWLRMRQRQHLRLG